MRYIEGSATNEYFDIHEHRVKCASCTMHMHSPLYIYRYLLKNLKHAVYQLNRSIRQVFALLYVYRLILFIYGIMLGNKLWVLLATELRRHIFLSWSYICWSASRSNWWYECLKKISMLDIRNTISRQLTLEIRINVWRQQWITIGCTAHDQTINTNISTFMNKLGRLCWLYLLIYVGISSIALSSGFYSTLRTPHLIN